jgi:hypothetical protein
MHAHARTPTDSVRERLDLIRTDQLIKLMRGKVNRNAANQRRTERGRERDKETFGHIEYRKGLQVCFVLTKAKLSLSHSLK